MANLGEISNDHCSNKSLNQEERNKMVVTTLYDAFGNNSNNDNNNGQSVNLLFALYLEWWFHGPPSHQHLKRLLTGSSPNDLSFPLVPLSLTAFESTVIAEGFDRDRLVSWVHAWTLSDGIVTHVREYYNTSVTVTHLGGKADVASTSTEIRNNNSYSNNNKCQSVWKSKLCDESSVPGLVLAL